MFIIWGFGHKTSKRFGRVNQSACMRCHNAGVFELVRVTVWFTLFFIPLVPYKKEYLITCPVCGGMRITKDEFEHILASGLSEGQPGNDGQAYQNHPQLPLQDQLQSGGQYQPPQPDKYAGKTETQIQYLKQMEELEKRNQGQA